jgi:hypothetical protein
MEIVIHGISRKEKFSKKGEKFESVGLKYRGKWYSGFGSKITDGWDVGMTVKVDLWEELGSDGQMYGKFVVLVPSKREQQKNVEKVNQETGEIIEEPLDDIPDDQAQAEMKAESEVAIEDLPF